MLAKAVKTIYTQKQQTSTYKGLRKYSSSHQPLVLVADCYFLSQSGQLLFFRKITIDHSGLKHKQLHVQLVRNLK